MNQPKKPLNKGSTDLSEEPKCIFDHSDKLTLVHRMQDDGTSYDYCHGCGWIDVKALFQQYAQPPVVADKELDEILERLEEKLSDEPGVATEIGWEQWSEKKQDIYSEAKAALLQREQRLVAEARVDELQRVQRLRETEPSVSLAILDRIAQLRHNTNTGKGE